MTVPGSLSSRILEPLSKEKCERSIQLFIFQRGIIGTRVLAEALGGGPEREARTRPPREPRCSGQSWTRSNISVRKGSEEEGHIRERGRKGEREQRGGAHERKGGRNHWKAELGTRDWRTHQRNRTNSADIFQFYLRDVFPLPNVVQSVLWKESDPGAIEKPLCVRFPSVFSVEFSWFGRLSCGDNAKCKRSRWLGLDCSPFSLIVSESSLKGDTSEVTNRSVQLFHYSLPYNLHPRLFGGICDEKFLRMKRRKFL